MKKKPSLRRGVASNVAIVIVVAVILSAALFVFLPTNVRPPTLTSTGIGFQACTDYSDSSKDCTNAINVPVLSGLTTKFPVDVKLQVASGSFTYQGTPKSWAFSCVGAISFGNGQSSPITASASGSGVPPSNWPISISPKQWNLSSIYGSNYGQKNLTAQLGSKASPCSLTVSFNELPTAMKMNYRYASLAKWSIQYSALSTSSSSSSNSSSSSSSSTSSSSSSSSSSTTQTSTSTTTTGGNTVTTSQKDIWTTTITSASGGATGNVAPNGIIATLAPDYYFQQTQSVVWVYYSATAYSQCSQGIFVVVVTPTTSVTVGRLTVYSNALIGGIAFPVAVAASNPYLLQVLCANSASTMLFNQVVTASAAQPLDAAPSPPFPTIMTATTTTSTVSGYITYITSTVGTDSATTSFATSSLASAGQTQTCYTGKCLTLSVISVTF